MTEGGDLREQLQALLADARAQERLAELEPLLREAVRECDTSGGRSDDGATADVPMSFGMVGDSPAMKAVYSLLERVAPSDVPVLIHGETGTGKELVARAIHEHSNRAKGPFLAENCAAVPATLLESELFGHKRGSFTGAVADRPGHFVAADKGSIFLDEIGDMPLEMQAKLLRVLELGEVRPVGASKPVQVDVRLIAATHRDLEAMVREKTFREDLFYRLNVIRIVLPALRERNGDIPHLVRYFLSRCAEDDDATPPELDSEALKALERHAWPGNVRQLENEIRRATALASGRIGLSDLSPELQTNA